VFHAAHLVLRQQHAVTHREAITSARAVRVPTHVHDLVAADVEHAGRVIEALFQLFSSRSMVYLAELAPDSRPCS
jgi:hypothetical protein